MVGDWFSLNGSYYQIEEISAQGWVHLTTNGIRVQMTTDYLLDVIEPIHVTEEMLSKNGFVRQITHGSPDVVMYENEDFGIILYYRNDDMAKYQWNVYSNHFGYDVQNLYVHVLQHILKLIDCDKKIRL